MKIHPLRSKAQPDMENASQDDVFIYTLSERGCIRIRCWIENFTVSKGSKFSLWCILYIENGKIVFFLIDKKEN